MMLARQPSRAGSCDAPELRDALRLRGRHVREEGRLVRIGVIKGEGDGLEPRRRFGRVVLGMRQQQHLWSPALAVKKLPHPIGPGEREAWPSIAAASGLNATVDASKHEAKR